MAGASGIAAAGDLASALARPSESKVPEPIDVIVDRECDCSTGGSIGAVREFV